MNTDNLPVHNASYPDAEEAGDADAMQGKNKVNEVVDVDDVESKRFKLKILLLVLLSIVFTRDWNGPTYSPTMIPTDPPTINRSSIIQDVIASSFEDDFPNSSFQEEALDWLANTDPANLPVDTDPTTLLERYIAVLFYFATKGAGWYDQRNWLTVNAVCVWNGLDCNDHGVLTEMHLALNNVVGQIPSELALLTHMARLTLHSNALTGSIPSALGLLTNLQFLNLYRNALTGSIPSELGLLTTDLTHLFLASNALTGSIPSELHQLTNTRMVLWGNNFTNCEDFKANHINPSRVDCVCPSYCW